jgi:hypothetical protein
MTTEVSERTARFFDDGATHESSTARRQVSLRLASAAEMLASFEIYLDDLKKTGSDDETVDVSADIARARFTIEFAQLYPPREDIFRRKSGIKKLEYARLTLLNANIFSSAISGAVERDPGDGDASTLIESWVALVRVVKPGQGRKITVPELGVEEQRD